MKNLFLGLALIFAGFEASAAFVKIAECQGYTDQNRSARVILFVNKAADTQGFISVNIQNQNDFGSLTQVAWNANPQGYPRFFNNDFDLDIVINDKTLSFDDILLGNEYVSRLQCAYDPTAPL